MIILVQTDTTAGFASKDLKEINEAKNRPADTPCLITLSKFSVLKDFVRVPAKFKNFARRTKKTTIIYPNKKSFRVVQNGEYAKFLDEIKWCYSSSANDHKKGFDLEFAKNRADVIADDKFFEAKPSRIVKISKTNMKTIRK